MMGLGRAYSPTPVLALLALALVLISGCARVGLPPGGPEDTTPPEVVTTVPEDGATEAARDTQIEIEFSEEMNRVSVEHGFSIVPDVELRNLRWDGATLVAGPVAELPDSTTFIVEIAQSAKDYHEVAIEEPFVLMFSTGGTLDTGVISGAVSVMGAAVPGATVWACRGSVTTDGGVIRGCRYAAVTDTDGAFRIVGVAAMERPYILLAFIDTDEDNVYSVREETGRIAETNALIDGPGAVAAGIQIELAGDLDEETPADVRGEE
ncbi:MAG: Ig-like domain-containing protein [Candidatus Eisenbacteria bacterium]|nr:Ig-like domain-containing protein [Candidatus Eisenbacteria bacterium]